MANIALFHSVLGVRHGVTDAERRLAAAGHGAELLRERVIDFCSFVSQ